MLLLEFGDVSPEAVPVASAGTGIRVSCVVKVVAWPWMVMISVTIANHAIVFIHPLFINKSRPVRDWVAIFRGAAPQIWLGIPQRTERQRIGNQIDAAFISRQILAIFWV